MFIDSNFKPMKVQIGPVDENNAKDLVVGRTKLVESLWGRLESRSILLLGERRMGKTWVLQLALAICPDWAVPHLLDAEKCDSAPQFVFELNRTLHQRGLVPEKWWSKVGDWFRRMLQRVQGQTVGPVSIPEVDPWASLLEDTCRMLVEHSGERRAVLMIDELPFFLDKLIKTGRPQEAIQLLDTLRSLRHEQTSLGFLVCGSLGLHIVLGKLHETGYTGQPVNDMHPFEVPPLDSDDARYLAGCLLVGESVQCSDIAAVAQAAAEASSNVPFYIQQVLDWMAGLPGEPWTPERTSGVPAELFDAAADPAYFKYYDARLDRYYPDDIVEKARAALDVLSREQEGMEFDQLVNLVRHRPKTSTVDTEELLGVLRILRDDHYVVGKENHWRFKLDIVRYWWYSARGRLAI